MDDLEVKRQIEFMVSKFQEFVNKFHVVDSKNKSLSDENTSLKDEIHTLRNDLTSLSMSNDARYQVLVTSNSEIDKKLVVMNDAITAQNKIQSSTSQLLASHCSVHDDLSSKLVALSKEHDITNTNVKKSYDVCNAQTLELLTYKEGVKVLSKELEEIKSKLTSCSQGHYANSSLIDEMRVSLSRVIDQQSEQYKKDLSNLNESIVAMKRSEDAIMKALNDRLDAIKIPSIEGFFRKEDIENLTKDIESIRLDSKNAYLKCSNADTQVQIMKKQIENLQLQLKNNDLNK